MVKELIKNIALNLVDHPEAVEVSEVEAVDNSVVELKVAKTDLGRVIGRQGRTATAMRTVLNAASKKVNKNVVLKIVE